MPITDIVLGLLLRHENISNKAPELKVPVNNISFFPFFLLAIVV